MFELDDINDEYLEQLVHGYRGDLDALLDKYNANIAAGMSRDDASRQMQRELEGEPF